VGPPLVVGARAPQPRPFPNRARALQRAPLLMGARAAQLGLWGAPFRSTSSGGGEGRRRRLGSPRGGLPEASSAFAINSPVGKLLVGNLPIENAMRRPTYL
jgi:hypothetical protein